MLPEGWNVARLGELAERVTSGSRGWASFYSTEGDRFIRITNLKRENIKLDLTDLKHVQLPQNSSEGQRTRLQIGDLLISITADLGVVGFVDSEPPVPSYINQHIALVRLNQNAVNPKFVAYYLASGPAQRMIQRLNDAGAKAGMNLPTIRSIPITLPCLAEQRTISSLLSDWDNAIETVDKLIDNARARKKGLMQQLLSGKRRLPGFEGKWEAARLGQLFDERTERAAGNESLLSITRARGVIPHAEAGRKDSSNEDKSKYKILRRGDIGYNTMRMWQGASALSEYDGIVSPAYTIVVPNERMDAHYAAHLFKLPRMVHDFQRYSQGLTSDQWTLKFPAFSEIKVRLPQPDEQRAIASVLDDADHQLGALANLAAKLSEEKRALMQQLLTGKRRVKVEGAA